MQVSKRHPLSEPLGSNGPQMEEWAPTQARGMHPVNILLPLISVGMGLYMGLFQGTVDATHRWEQVIPGLEATANLSPDETALALLREGPQQRALIHLGPWSRQEGNGWRSYTFPAATVDECKGLMRAWRERTQPLHLSVSIQGQAVSVPNDAVCKAVAPADSLAMTLSLRLNH